MRRRKQEAAPCSESGDSGIGSTHHLAMEAMRSALGLDVLHVPFKGTGQSVPALVGGQVAVVFSAYPSLAGFVKDGRVKLLAANSIKRSSLAPEVPTIDETFIPGYDFAPTIGIWAATGTPPEVIARVAADAADVVKMPAVVEQMTTLGIEPAGGSAEELNAQVRDDQDRYAKAVKASGAKVD